MTTDASLAGWGAHLQDLQAQGLWSEEEKQLHINYLELKAVFLALKTFLPTLKNTAVRILTDNTACMYYIRKQGGTRSRPLSLLAQELWKWAILNGIRLTAYHLAGVKNVQADHLSRVINESQEWELDQGVTDSLFREWGEPDIDLFATAESTKCRRFASRWKEEGSVGDALIVHWHYQLLYAFPPTPLIHKVLVKLRAHNTHMILIAPAWPRQTWFAEIKKMSVAREIPLGADPTLLSRDDGRILHHDPVPLKLTAWLLRS